MEEQSQSHSQFPGRIVLDRVRDARPIRSFIAKKLTKWLEAHGITPQQQPSCDVALNKSNYGHLFTCRIELHTDGSHWSAMVTERDLHQAILSALNHLAPQRLIPQRRTYALQPA